MAAAMRSATNGAATWLATVGLQPEDRGGRSRHQDSRNGRIETELAREFNGGFQSQMVVNEAADRSSLT